MLNDNFERDVNVAMQFKSLDPASISANMHDVKIALKPSTPEQDTYWESVRSEADKRISQK